jgi:hypothetical protein
MAAAAPVAPPLAAAPAPEEMEPPTVDMSLELKGVTPEEFKTKEAEYNLAVAKVRAGLWLGWGSRVWERVNMG